MSEFRTDFTIEGLPKELDHNSMSFLIGSCFTENIGNKLIENKFKTETNPFGILYNPVSIKNSLDFILDEKIFKESDLFFANNLWGSYYHHSKFSNSDKNKCLNKINKLISKAGDCLLRSDFLFITFGTSKVYELLSSGEIVSNCHKQVSKNFRTYFLESERIVDAYSKLIKRIREINSSVKIVFTVSPVRHWQDGVIQNQISKSNLIIAVDQILNSFENVYYFPAYEIMMDDLRDYRFYNEDMIHPNQIAVKYIWEKFSEGFITKASFELSNEIKKINKAFTHRPFNPETQSHKLFLENNLEQIQSILKRFPDLDFNMEKKYFSGK